MNVTFVGGEELSPHAKTFWFRPERPVRYLAGQFTELYLPHEDADARGIRRWFTLSSSPTDELLSITTAFAPDGSSYKRRLAALTPGAPLQLAEPMGDFVLPKDPSLPLVFVAGGLGITPVHSMVKFLLDSGEQRDIQLIYIVHTPDELLFEPVFNAYGLHFLPIFTQGSGGHRQSVTAASILELIRDRDRSLLYLSGPELMVEHLGKDLKAQGFAEERLIIDYFPGYQAL